jgi:hypothetical protein
MHLLQLHSYKLSILTWPPYGHRPILDSGTTSHFLMVAATMTNMRPTNKPTIAWLPNGKHVHSTHTCTLNIPALPALA